MNYFYKHDSHPSVFLFRNSWYMSYIVLTVGEMKPDLRKTTTCRIGKTGPFMPFTENSQYAHKPFVIKNDGVVYHFYCAVDENGNRRTAVAVSKNPGKSTLRFPLE